MEDEVDGQAQGESAARPDGGAQEQGNAQAKVQEIAGDANGGVVGGEACKAAIAERDGRIAELEAQIVEAARTAETAERLRVEIADLKQQGAEERVDFSLQLAGCRNVKAARAVLADYGGDVDKMREAELWLFAKHAAAEGAAGKTGLPSAGAASDEGRDMKRWRRLAGLDDGTDE